MENGTLTPEEFLQAGDQLTFKFPTWQWEGGDPSRRVSYLPSDKQYLITRNVPCRVNVRTLDYMMQHKTRTEDEWLLPEAAAGGQPGEGDGELRDIDDLAGDGEHGATSSVVEDGPLIGVQEDFLDSSGPQGKDGAGLPDFSDLDAELAEEDPASRPFGAGSADASGDAPYLIADAPDANVVRTRTYDLSITYDKYYQTPRMWLFGYDEGGEPLKPDQVYEDILTEYVSKTVTVDMHPLTGTPTVSIHPCKHAQVMKKVVADWIEQGINPRHDLALFVFLKFISGVVPTINYDFTMDIEF